MPNPRDPKRKAREGSEDAAPRKKQQKTDEVQYQDFGDGAKPKVTRKFKDKFAPKPEKEYPSINDLKKRIRDVKRLLNKVDLPADARILQERALSGYEQDLADETARRERSQIIKKYHFVRFLDRKTATRDLNRQLRRQREQELDTEEKALLAEKIYTGHVNLNYTIYYPLTEKYLSIYPKSDGKTDAPESKTKSKKPDTEIESTKPPLWSVVAQCMTDKTLDLLRDGKLNINFNGEKIVNTSAAAPASNASQEKSKKKDSQKEPKGVSQKEKHLPKEDKKSKKEKSVRSEGSSKRDVPQEVIAEEQDDSDGGFFE
ncbi:uncharacterized protein N7511_010270 [Penicillium nucicola]|uniref:uncharacterized protein n=1 Tax=Penicillium nucicola TaxID=1850975 RepID=UPI0025457EC3|nr:uncharacterized protein N7511_010270 [Penicillium nucicola]KAJ5748574.1 hypothetical protein N7511_010270 [Penicillium nucicola]